MTESAAGDSLAELLAWQCGVLSRSQALERGISDGALAAHVRAGRWRRICPGMYATTTGPLATAARQWAAVLACGPGAVLSHETAAVMHGLRVGNVNRLHVTVPIERRVRPVAGIRVHRSGRLPRTRHPTLEPPRTRVEATVIDLVDTAKDVERALSIVAQACQRRLTTATHLRTEVSLRRTVHWRREIAAALDDVGSGAHSLLELIYLRDVERRHGLPSGRRQRSVHRGLRREWTDVSYDEYSTVVELDGRAGHSTVSDIWRDMRRDNAVVAAGEAPLRYGWADVTGRPCGAAGQVAAVLRMRGWTGKPRKCGASCEL